MRVLFMGTPEFALPSLRILVQDYTLVGVVTQPDRPSGRQRRMTASPVKQYAVQHDLVILQPDRIKAQEAIERIQDLAPELIVVAAFGQILSPEVLQIPKHGCLNIHASLLPRWRGAAPIQASILHGDEVTGITLMLMDEGLDTGPILAQESTPIHSSDTAGGLSQKLAELGAIVLRHTLPDYLAGNLKPIPQDEANATLAPKLRKSDGELNFSKPALELERQVRAFHPWPGSFFRVGGRRIGVLETTVNSSNLGSAGVLIEHDGLLAIATVEGTLLLNQIQPAGKQPMSSIAFLAGNRVILGLRVDPVKE